MHLDLAHNCFSYDLLNVPDSATDEDYKSDYEYSTREIDCIEKSGDILTPSSDRLKCYVHSGDPKNSKNAQIRIPITRSSEIPRNT